MMKKTTTRWGAYGLFRVYFILPHRCLCWCGAVVQVNELVNELDAIEASFLEQGYTKDRNPSNSNSAGTVQVSLEYLIGALHCIVATQLFY